MGRHHEHGFTLLEIVEVNAAAEGTEVAASTSMMELTKVLVFTCVAAVAAATFVIVTLGHKLRVGARPAAGMMFVGAVDEVELSGPMRTDHPEGFDPEEIPSEHREINQLREQMPFG